MKHAVCVIILLSLLNAAIPSVALAQDQSETRTINVIGTGRIYGEDIAGARDQAIADCLITAISQSTADLLHQQVFIQSFKDINRLILSSADKFVQDYKVLTEDTTGRIYRVLVQTTVAVEKIRDLLIQNDILSQNATPLKVLLLIAEQDLDDLFYKYWWGDASAETVSDGTLSSALVEQGFVVVDHSPSLPAAVDSDALGETPPGPETDNSRIAGDSGSLEETPPGPEMSNGQAAALGARFQADVVVVGTATVKKTSNVMGNELKSFEGILSVRAVRPDTGLVLAEITRNYITADTDDLVGGHMALTEAGSRTGELLAGQIQTAWQQQTAKEGPTAATIVVEGNYQLSHLVALRRILSGMPGVSGLQTRGMTPEETILSLDYDGTTKGLAEALLLNSFDGFGVHITEATPDAIRLSLVSE